MAQHEELLLGELLAKKETTLKAELEKLKETSPTREDFEKWLVTTFALAIDELTLENATDEIYVTLPLHFVQGVPATQMFQWLAEINLKHKINTGLITNRSRSHIIYCVLHTNLPECSTYLRNT